MADYAFGVIGAGNMAEAILRGLIAGNVLSRNAVVASDPVFARRQHILDQVGVTCVDDNRIPAACGRVGWGYDIHRLVPGRPLWLGGVHIPFDRGLAGHSDADALVHAIADAILGALNAGDLGQHFPDTDERYRNAASLDLLQQVAGLMRGEGYTLGNVDAMVLAEAPRLAPYRTAMQERLADALQCTPQQISLKATTHEGLGAVGAGAGIAAQAVVNLYRI